ncbi:T-complex protein 1, eta subunit [Onchocerca flexuosa]|uniref:T-complex protein 1 subunit eta n=1 Tax=Onchocerca flexuosa TaxID=387005 RepID=A0A238BVS1_9BILA|nr:T-complex protein 1, eta subunit [Onchocerca flexuosa]
MMMNAPIILLKEGTEAKFGKQQIISNISACNVIADSVRTTLGPRGMDKLVIDSKGKTTISNDGATILKLLDVVFPAAQVMVDIAKSQDAEVGDGTTSVVILSAELLKRSKPFIEDGVSPQLIIRSYSKACEEAISRLKQLAVKISGDANMREMLKRCATTCLSSKLISQEREFFAEMAVDAVSYLDENLSSNMIGIKKVSGGSLSDSQLVKGIAFKKAFSYAGFEMQPKHYKNPLIALLNIELELKAEKDNAEMRIQSVDEYQKVSFVFAKISFIVDAEWTILYDKLKKIHESGAKVVLSKLPIGDVATQWDMFCAGRVEQADMDRLIAACGGTILTTVSQISKELLGSCAEFYEQQVGSERYNFFLGGMKAQSCTVILRGSAEQFIAETERSLHDAIMVVRRAKKNDTIVAGGGAIEMELSRLIRDISKTIAGKEQFFWQAFAKTLEDHKCLGLLSLKCLSFSFLYDDLRISQCIDATDILNRLRHRHAKGDKWAGVDIYAEDVSDNMEACIWEPAVVKINALTAATEAACLVLSIDQTIKNPRAASGGQLPDM